MAILMGWSEYNKQIIFLFWPYLWRSGHGYTGQYVALSVYSCLVGSAPLGWVATELAVGARPHVTQYVAQNCFL